MSIDLRPPRDDAETEVWFAAEATAFGDRLDPDWVAGETIVLPRDRMLGVWEGDACVATSGSYPFDLTLPGGAAVAVAGVADVAVLSSRRRRGLLTEMMRQLHADARDRGEVAAVLTASDGSIYSRFGYGIAASVVMWELDAHRAVIESAPVDLELDVIHGVEAADPLADLWARCMGRRAGTLSRTLEWWRLVVGPKEQWKGGGNVHTLLLVDGAGEPQGAACYRPEFRADRGVQDWKVEVLDLFATSDDAEARLWQEVCRLDHVGKVAVRTRPVDDPLRWRLRDSRQMKVQMVGDLLWLCPLDVSRLLSARAYGSEGSLVLQVDDPFDELVAGTYRLSVGDGTATCERVSTGEPDVRLRASTLGALSLGGTTFGVQAAAGHVEECTPGALARADALFHTPLAPYNSTFF